jgi:SAM-dependent methyltransferase
MHNNTKTHIFSHFNRFLAPPHPTWQSKTSRNRVHNFLYNEQFRSPGGIRLNIGSGSKRFDPKTFNLDLFAGRDVDIQGDALHLPVKTESVESIVCAGVLEHLSDPHQALSEIHRVLKLGGKIFIETPFMQTVHASPEDFYRWTPDGLRQIMRAFEVKEIEVVAGPASALAWQFQETMAMLFSMHNEVLYKIGLRTFGWLAVPISWLDVFLERNPMAWHAASGFALLAEKRMKEKG